MTDRVLDALKPPVRAILLTPGPLTTSEAVRAAMRHDWGSWDSDFRTLTQTVGHRIRQVAGLAENDDRMVWVPMQGSGTFAVEAAVGTLVPSDGELLVLVNGAYGRRIVSMCQAMDRPHRVLDVAEDRIIDASVLANTLDRFPSITHVAAIHCETSTGMLNPLPELAAVAAEHGKPLLVDAMSSFGILPIPLDAQLPLAIIASSNKGLQGPPGLAFVIAQRTALIEAKGRSRSLSLDLYDQWQYMERTGQFRYTPPTHVIAGLAAALDEYKDEGGQPARLRRYQANYRTLMDGMAGLGFVPLLDPALQAPVIVTFLTPSDPQFRFDTVYEALKRRGYIVYPGKLTDRDTFRVGCIGAIGPKEMEGFVRAMAETLEELGITDRRPA